jgi:hypothetical protein
MAMTAMNYQLASEHHRIDPYRLKHVKNDNIHAEIDNASMPRGCDAYSLSERKLVH